MFADVSRSPTPPACSSTRTATTSSAASVSSRWPSCGAGQVRARIPVPAQRHREGGQVRWEAFRGFTLHIVLETLPTSRVATAGDVRPLRATRGPTVVASAQPALVAGQRVQEPAQLRRRRRPAHRQGTSRVGPELDRRTPGSGCRDPGRSVLIINALLAPLAGHVARRRRSPRIAVGRPRWCVARG